MKIGIIGDLHFKEKLSYDDCIEGGRQSEVDEVVSCIHSSFADCDYVVFLGDNFDKKNNPSSVIKRMTEMIETISKNKKQVFIIAGNHEKYGDGSSAIDYLKAVDGKNWTVVTNSVESFSLEDGKRITLCPYFYHTEFQLDNYEEAQKVLLNKLSENASDILFHHHAVSGSQTTSGQLADLFHEIILPKTFLESTFGSSFGGHVHKPAHLSPKTHVAGSIFAQEVGEIDKFVFIYDTETGGTEEIKLPGRAIRKIDIKPGEVLPICLRTIAKVCFGQDISSEDKDKIKEECLKKYDGCVFVEEAQYVRVKDETKTDKHVSDLSVEEMLELYASSSNVDITLLKKGYNIIL